MFELNVRIAADEEEALGAVEVPRAFMLVGKGHANVIGRTADEVLVVDAEGVVLRSGAVYAWCCGGCCSQPTYWSSVDAVGDFHGSVIVVEGDGTVRALGETASGDTYPGGDVPEAG